jgi:hypothetical protein
LTQVNVAGPRRRNLSVIEAEGSMQTMVRWSDGMRAGGEASTMAAPPAGAVDELLQHLDRLQLIRRSCSKTNTAREQSFEAAAARVRDAARRGDASALAAARHILDLTSLELCDE